MPKHRCQVAHNKVMFKQLLQEEVFDSVPLKDDVFETRDWVRDTKKATAKSVFNRDAALAKAKLAYERHDEREKKRLEVRRRATYVFLKRL